MADQQQNDRPLENSNPAASSNATPVAAKPPANSRQLRVLVLLIVGIAAGTAVWTVAPGMAKDIGALPEDLRAKTPGSDYNFELFKEIKAAERQGARRGAMLLFGIFGATVGASLALVNGLQGRSVVGAIVGLIAGLLMGGGMGVLMGSLGLDLQDWLTNSLPFSFSSYRPVLVHLATWGGVGLGIGLATGLSVLSIKSAIKGLVIVSIAGVGAAFLYAVVSAILAPMQNADKVIPTGAFNQWIWMTLASGIMGLAVTTINKDAVTQTVSEVTP